MTTTTRLPTTTADNDFRAFFEMHVPAVHDLAAMFMAKGEQVPPLFMVHSHNQQVAVVPIEHFATVEDKNLVAGLQRGLAMMPLVKAVIFICEVWTLTSDQRHDSISDHPDRGEALMLNGMSRGQNGDRAPAIMQLIAHLPFETRDGARTLSKTPKEGFIDPTAGHYEGRFVANEPTEH